MSEDLEPQEVIEDEEEDENQEEGEENENDEAAEFRQAVLEALSDTNEELVRIRRALETMAGGAGFVKEQEKQRSKPPAPKKVAKKKGR